MTRAQIADPAPRARSSRPGAPRTSAPASAPTTASTGSTPARTPSVCTTSPRAARRSVPHVIPRARSARRVVVAGAGPAGLEAARVCAERGHDVVVFERAERVGGQLLTWRRALRGGRTSQAIVGWLGGQLRRLDVERSTSSWEATPEARARRAAGRRRDRHRRPPQPGPSPRAPSSPMTTWDVLAGTVRPTGRVLVYDEHGEHQAPSCAELLARAGCQVELASPARVVVRGARLDQLRGPPARALRGRRRADARPSARPRRTGGRRLPGGAAQRVHRRRAAA